MDRECHILTELHRVHDHGNHSVHKEFVACEGAHLHHSQCLVGAVVGVVFHYWTTNCRRCHEHGFQDEVETGHSDMEDDTVSIMDSICRADGDGANDAVLLGGLETRV